MDYSPQSLTGGLREALREQALEEGRRKRAVYDAQVVLPHLLSGQAMFVAMKRAVNDLVRSAPQDHDVLIQIGDLSVIEAQFIEPHTFLFEGINQDGHRSGI